MSASLVRGINTVGSAGYGVNLWDIAPPSSTVGQQSKTIGIVGDFPWGPTNTPTVCYSPQDVINTFCPDPFAALASYNVFKAFIGKKFPGPITVCRIAATSQVSRADSYTVTGGAYVATANYPGAVASKITITFAAATDAVSTHRNITIAVGTTYSVTYANVTTTSILTLGDPYITWTASSSPSVLPAAGASASSTTAGADGTAIAGDYVGSSSSNVGIRQFYASNVDVDWLFVAECPSALIDTVNTGLKAYAQDNLRGSVVLCSPPSQTVSTAVTYAGTYSDTGSRVVLAWPRVKVTDDRDPTFPTITVDGNAFVAVAAAAVDPWNSPEGNGATAYLTKITDLETNNATDSAYASLLAAGVTTFFLESTLGPIIRGAVVTNTVSGSTDIIRTNFRRYAQKNIAAYAIYYVGLALQVDLTNQRLGEQVAPLVDAIRGFLADEKAKGHISDFSVDPFGANTTADIAAGRWTIATNIKTFSPLRTLIIRTQIGSTVVVSS